MVYFNVKIVRLRLRLNKIQVTLKTISIYNTRKESPQLVNYIFDLSIAKSVINITFKYVSNKRITNSIPFSTFLNKTLFERKAALTRKRQ